MAEWLDFHLRLEGRQEWVFLFPLLLALVYLVYQRTRPLADRKWRWLLVGLRSLALGLLALMLAEPVLGLLGKQVRRPGVLLLVDTSPSMALEEEGGQRLAKVEQVLSLPEFRQALAPARVEAWGFAAEPYSVELDTLDRVRVRGQATDLARALEKSLEQTSAHLQVQAILLFSDGAHNLGQDPVEAAAAARVPVYALSVGQDKRPADIQIVRAEAPGTGYLGHPLAVEAQVRSWGYAGREVQVLLREGEQDLDRQSLILPGDGLVAQVSFQVEPKTPGPHIYRLVVQPQEGEFSRDNNEVLVFTRILQDRVRVLLVAGGPSPDLAFARRSLALDSSLVVEAMVEKAAGSLYQGRLPEAEEWKRWDVVALVDPDPGMLDGGAGQALAAWVQQGGGLVFVGGAKSFRNWDPGGALAGLLPVSLAAGARFVSQDTPLRLSQEGRRHPVARPREEEAGSDPWAQVPPFPGYFPVGRKAAGTVVLVEAATPQRQPLVLAGPHGRGKVVAVLSYGLWRLDLLSSGTGARPQTIRSFWQNAARWLALEEPAGRVRVSTSRQVYRGGEEVRFAAQVSDELLRPQEQAVVQIFLEGGEPVLRLSDQGGGNYEGGLTDLAPGDYRYTARAYLGDALVGADEGRFLVEEYSVESVDVKPDRGLLEEMARSSGGQCRPLEEWRQVVARLALAPRLVGEARLFPLWGQSWSLVLVILLLSLEWALRQRLGML